MCKYCEKRVEIKCKNKLVSDKHPHNPIWFEINYVGNLFVDMYLDVDINKLNRKVKLNYCPFCGREL